MHVSYKNRYGRERSYYTTFEGVIPYVERRHAEASSDTSRERFEEYMREVPCLTCNGARLKPISLAVTLGGKNIAEISAMSIDEVHDFLRRHGAVAAREADRGAGASRRSASGCGSCSTSAWTTWR